MINIFGKKIKGTATEIQPGKRYVFVTEAKNGNEFRKYLEVIKSAADEHGIGGVVLNKPMTVVDLEKLSNLEHQQWISWSRYVYDEMLSMGFTQAAEHFRKKWEPNWVEYDKLPEDVKEKDREWAVKILELK